MGRHRLIADGIKTIEDELKLVSAASHVLADWPKNFIALLQDIGDRVQPASQGGVRKQFESIYSALFKNRAITPINQTDFLRVAFLDFVENHWGRGYVDPKLLKHARGRVNSRFITQSEFAARAGINILAASRLLKENKVPSSRVRCGKSDRILVDLSRNVIPRTCPGKVYREREAAKRLGLSVRVLRALKDDGTFEFNHHLSSKGGYHEVDIDAFRNRLLELAPPQVSANRDANSEIAMKAVMVGHHDSPNAKVDVVRALLAGKLTIVGNTDGTIAGLFLDKTEYDAIAITSRSHSAGDTMPSYIVEKHLHCDASAVPGLLRMGLLAGHMAPTGLRITSKSVAAFQSEYVSLASIAQSIGSSSRGLMRRCEEIGINLLTVPRNGRGARQLFLRISDRARLIGAR